MTSFTINAILGTKTIREDDSCIKKDEFPMKNIKKRKFPSVDDDDEGMTFSSRYDQDVSSFQIAICA